MKRLTQLDGVRGLSLLIVLVFHYVWSQVHTTPGTLPAKLMNYLLWSYSAVDLFFVLSGFLITGIVLDHVAAGNFLKVFYLRRACRILPLYGVAVLAFVIGRHFLADDWRFIWLFKDPLPTWHYLTFTQNFAMAGADTSGPHWIDVTWSLAVEEHFYLLIPVLVCLIARRWLPWVFAVMIIAAPLLRQFLPLSNLNAYFSTPWRADSIMAGALLAWCVRQPVILQYIRTHVRKLYWVMAILPPFLLLLTWSGFNQSGAFEHTIFAAFYSALLLLVFVDETSPITKLMRWRPLAWVGTVSYGLYLFHEPISGLAHALVRSAPPEINSISSGLVTLTALVITFVLATVSYYLFERHIVAYGHTFKYTKSEEPLPTPSTAPQLQPLPIPLDARR